MFGLWIHSFCSLIIFPNRASPQNLQTFLLQAKGKADSCCPSESLWDVNELSKWRHPVECLAHIHGASAQLSCYWWLSKKGPVPWRPSKGLTWIKSHGIIPHASAMYRCKVWKPAISAFVQWSWLTPLPEPETGASAIPQQRHHAGTPASPEASFWIRPAGHNEVERTASLEARSWVQVHCLLLTTSETFGWTIPSLQTFVS